MNFLRSVAMAFTMFSRIPMPQVEWKKENMQYMLAAFPLVGVLESAILFGWAYLAEWLGMGSILFAAGMTLLPVLYTGGIHLDGFCDTVDALASRGSIEKKRQILKDSHTGAFAVIFVCAYMLTMFALFTEVPHSISDMVCILVIPILSRTISGFASVCFPAYGETGLLATFRGSAKRISAAVILCICFVVCTTCTLFANTLCGIVIPLTSALCGVYVFFMSKRQFGGMSGDLAGYLLQITELAMLGAFILVQKVGVL